MFNLLPVFSLLLLIIIAGQQLLLPAGESSVEQKSWHKTGLATGKTLAPLLTNKRVGGLSARAKRDKPPLLLFTVTLFIGLAFPLVEGRLLPLSTHSINYRFHSLVSIDGRAPPISHLAVA